MKRVGIYLAALTLALTSSLPVWASEQGGHGGGAALPQLDVALYPGLLFWMGLTFVVLLIAMQTVGVPGVRKTLEKRQAALDVDLGAARQASEDAQKVMQAYETALLEARRKAQDTVAGIVEAAEKEAAAQNEKQRDELAHRMVVAENNIAQARQEAMKEAPKFINDLVQDIVGKVMHSGVSGARG